MPTSKEKNDEAIAARQATEAERTRRIVEKAVANGTARAPAPMVTRKVDPATLKRPDKPLPQKRDPTRIYDEVRGPSLDLEQAMRRAAGVDDEEPEEEPQYDPGRDPGPPVPTPRDLGEDPPASPVASEPVATGTRICKLEGCDVEFEPSHHKQLYCTPAHSKAGRSAVRNNQKRRQRKRQAEAGGKVQSPVAAAEEIRRQDAPAPAGPAEPQASDSSPGNGSAPSPAPDSSPEREYPVPPRDPTAHERYISILFALLEDGEAPPELRLRALERLDAHLSAGASE